MLVNAISASIMPVINALVIVMIVIAIYAVLGVTFFSALDPDNFAQFTIAFFTMFQVATPCPTVPYRTAPYPALPLPYRYLTVTLP